MGVLMKHYLLLVMLVCGLGLMSTNANAQYHYGPYYREGAIPTTRSVPDEFRVWLNNRAQQIYQNTSMRVNVGDFISVCNGEICARFELLEDSQWISWGWELDQAPGPGDGGGGNGCGGFGGGTSGALQPVYHSWHVTSNVPGDPGHWVTYVSHYVWAKQSPSTFNQVC